MADRFPLIAASNKDVSLLDFEVAFTFDRRCGLGVPLSLRPLMVDIPGQKGDER